MAKRSIVVNPDKWDADIIDCPFADQDCYCGLIKVGAAAVCLFSKGNEDSCPLKAGPVEVRLAVSDYKPQPLRPISKGDVDKLY